MLTFLVPFCKLHCWPWLLVKNWYNIGRRMSWVHASQRRKFRVHCRDKNLPAAAAAKSLQSCLTLCDPIDGSPPGPPIPRILQARTLEWVAISFSLVPCKYIPEIGNRDAVGKHYHHSCLKMSSTKAKAMSYLSLGRLKYGRTAKYLHLLWFPAYNVGLNKMWFLKEGG